MNRKNLPLLLMLTGGAVTCIITYVRHYTVLGKLVSLLIVLVIFYALGSLFKWMLDYFDKQNAKAALDQGEVIEKEQEQGQEKKAEEGDGSKGKGDAS